MQMFRPETPNSSPRHQRIYAMFEIAHTAVDFAAAFQFVVGSVFFFWPSTQTTATWLFVFGSICFALKPTIRLARELKFLSMGDLQTLASRDEAAG